MKSILQLRQSLLAHQQSNKFGDHLQTLTEISKRAGVHRDTVYACINGDRISERTQYALSRVLEEIEVENLGKTKTKIMNITIGKNGANLKFGIGNKLFN